MTTIPTKFPKVESPYHRGENDEGDYVIEGYSGEASDSGSTDDQSESDPGGPSDYVNEKFSWVFDRADEVEAIEKLDGCFTYESRVTTKENGSIQIGKIVNNELDVSVLSYNFDTGQAEYREIEEYHTYDQNTPLVTIRVSHKTHGGNNRTIVATQDHEVWTDDGWVEAGNLTEDQTVYRAGTTVGPEFDTDNMGLIASTIKSVEQGTEGWRNTSSVYDLTVESNHNYFVGGVLVHNTNMAIRIGEHENGGLSVRNVSTRMGDKSMNQVDPFGPRTNHHYIARAVQNSVRRGYTDWLADEYGEGWYFGEALGPKFQSNPHELDEHLFVPFDWVRDKLEYQSYGDYSTEFDAIRDWFRGEENGLFSLFASRMHGQDLDASRPQNGTFVEGIIFVHPDFEGRLTPGDLTTDENGRMNEIAKLRRDMFQSHADGSWPMTEYGHN